MTRRERLENKVAKRLEWAAGRRSKAAGLDARNKPFEGDIAFNTQPGHIPERARVIARTEKAFGHREMATHHEAKADGLAHAIERSIFSDDPDAVEAITAKIAGLEAERDRRKAINKEIRKGPVFEARLTAAGIQLTDDDKAELLKTLKYSPYHCDKKTGLPVFPGYFFTNLNGNISRLKERIKSIEAREANAARAEAAGGVDVKTANGSDYAVVTFAEKPDRATLDSLKAAWFWWSNGSWVGKLADLPETLKVEREGGVGVDTASTVG